MTWLMQIVRACKKYLLSHTVTFIIYACVAILQKVVGIISPYLTGNFINGLIGAKSTSSFVYRYCLTISGICLLNILMGYLSTRLYIYLQMSMGSAYNLDVIRHMQRVPLLDLVGKDIVRLNQQINGDTNALIIFCLNLANSFAVNLIILPIIFVICLKINTTISICFLIYCFLYMAVYTLVRQKKFKISFQYMDAQNRYFSALFEQLQYIGFIRSQGVSKYFISRITVPYQTLYKATIDSQSYSYFLDGIDTILSLLCHVTLYIIGANQVMKGAFSVGGFIIFTAYFSVILSSLRYFYGFGTLYQETKVSFFRLQELVGIREESNGKVIPSHINSVKIRELSFSYNNHVVITELNEQFRVGEICAIVGQNGSGKSTLARILLGLYSERLEKNSISFNDIDLHDIEKGNLRRYRFAYVDQNPVVFEGSMQENIMMGDCSADRWTRAQKLAEILHLDIINNQAGCINMLEGKLSGGEKQKISLIRSLSKESELILLDEPTSSMDYESKMGLMEYLQHIKLDKIIIIVTHDETVIKMCDRKVALESSDN